MSFFRALFDFSFSEFITIKIIKILYVIAIILLALTWIGGLIGFFAQGGLYILLGLIVAPIGFILSVIFVRVIYEILIVIFGIAEHTRDMAWALTGGRKAPGGPLMPPQQQAPYPPQPQPQPYMPPQPPPQQPRPQTYPQYPQQPPQQPPQYPSYPQQPPQPPQYPPKP